MKLSGNYTVLEAQAIGQLAKIPALWPKFKLEIIFFFEDDGNVANILEVTTDYFRVLVFNAEQQKIEGMHTLTVSIIPKKVENI